MKNIEKKWVLFLIATFVTFFGIGYTLIKGTEAKEDELLGMSFDYIIGINDVRGDING